MAHKLVIYTFFKPRPVSIMRRNSKMSKLLIQENPMMILPSLAKKIGLNQAIVIKQFHYWLLSSKHTIDGRKWIYNSYKEWELQFTFWSGKTVERTIRSLED